MLINHYMRSIPVAVPSDGLFDLMTVPTTDGNGDFDLSQPKPPAVGFASGA